MKHPIALALASVLCWTGLAPVPAQAIEISVSTGHRHYRHHHYRHDDLVWVRGHYVWRHHHRHWIPGHYVRR